VPAVLILNGDQARARAAAWIAKAPPLTRVEFRETKRSNEQNARLWACLTDIAQQHDYHGVKLSPDDWKLLFLDQLEREVRAVPNLDGTGFVNIGTSSSKLSKKEMGDMLELIHAYAAMHGITLHDGMDGI
jgi:hypothetical protein